MANGYHRRTFLRGLDGDALVAIVPELETVSGGFGERVFVALAESFLETALRCSDAIGANEGEETEVATDRAMGESLGRAFGIK